MEKSGFIYLWFDRKHKRYYIGSHWGTETDGYICSSAWMKNSWKRRPQDFKRRIISRNISRPDLLTEEYYWLSQINDQEIGKKYYNLSKHKPGHWSHSNSSLQVGQKISKALKGKPTKSSGKFSHGNKIGIEFRFSSGQISHNTGKSLEERYGDRSEEIRKKMSIVKTGKSLKNSGSFGNRPAWNKGLTRIWITNGVNNKCLYGNLDIPDNWWRGRTRCINNESTMEVI